MYSILGLVLPPREGETPGEDGEERERRYVCREWKFGEEGDA